MFGSQRADALEKLLDGPGCTEVQWNIITLSKCLHHLWDEGLFAMEPLPLSPADAGQRIRVRVQWFWPELDSGRHLTNPQPSIESINDMFESLFSHRNTQRAYEVNVATAQVILTGQVYTITCDDEDERNLMFQALGARWDLQRVQFMAGAAGVPDYELDLMPRDDHPDCALWKELRLQQRYLGNYRPPFVPLP